MDLTRRTETSGSNQSFRLTMGSSYKTETPDMCDSVIVNVDWGSRTEVQWESRILSGSLHVNPVNPAYPVYKISLRFSLLCSDRRGRVNLVKSLAAMANFPIILNIGPWLTVGN